MNVSTNFNSNTTDVDSNTKDLMNETTAILAIFIIAGTIVGLYICCRNSDRDRRDMQGKINRAEARIQIRYNL
jgi:preprotein translocase subunit SecG